MIIFLVPLRCSALQDLKRLCTFMESLLFVFFMGLVVHGTLAFVTVGSIRSYAAEYLLLLIQTGQDKQVNEAMFETSKTLAAQNATSSIVKFHVFISLSLFYALHVTPLMHI